MPALQRNELADLNVFLLICRRKSFRLAALELGVTTSAISHTLRSLEARLGVRLLNRTSRAVVPTDAGAAFLRHLETGFAQIELALNDLHLYRESPSGRLRLNIPRDAGQLLFRPILARFMATYPELSLEITVDNNLVDIIGSGYDAGIRYGASVPKDMIAMPLTPKLRWIVVASPDYLRDAPPLQHPDDLRNHRCIRMRLGNGTLYKWPLAQGKVTYEVDVPGTLTLNESDMIIDAVAGGYGLGYCPERYVQVQLASGQLVRVLTDWCSEDEPLVMYYPDRRQLHPGLRRLIEMIRAETMR